MVCEPKLKRYQGEIFVMPDLNDFHAFKSTTSGNQGGGNGSGCLKPWVVIVIIIAVLILIGKCSA